MIFTVKNGSVRVHINVNKSKVLLTSSDEDSQTRCLLSAEQAKAIAAELIDASNKIEEIDG